MLQAYSAAHTKHKHLVVPFTPHHHQCKTRKIQHTPATFSCFSTSASSSCFLLLCCRLGLLGALNDSTELTLFQNTAKMLNRAAPELRSVSNSGCATGGCVGSILRMQYKACVALSSCGSHITPHPHAYYVSSAGGYTATYHVCYR